jgi:RsiW-degrading membrane proteinase PrsW (M82 family)
MFLYSIIASIIPMLIYLYFLRKFDKNEPEPIKLVLYHFFYGASIAIIIGIIGSKIISLPLNFISNQETISILKVILIAPFVEEISKATLLFKTINKNYVDNLTDGLVYGGAIGLGFGATENFLYFFIFGESLSLLLPLIIMRTAFSAVMHALATATVGGIMSLAKYSSPFKQTIATIFGLLLAIFIHFIWNLSVSFSQTVIMGVLFILFIIIIFIFTYYFSLKFENKIIRKELENEIPNQFIEIITSTNKSRKKWFLETYQKSFTQKAILLAFRKHEVDISSRNRELYIKEIDQLRLEISELINLFNNSKLSK